MPDKSFEKNVQDNLDGFGLAPSAKVWMHVEEELHRKDKRRRGVIWLFFGVAALLGGVFLIYTPSSQISKQPDIVAGPLQPVNDINAPTEKKRTIDSPQPAGTQNGEPASSGKPENKKSNKNNLKSVNPVKITSGKPGIIAVDILQKKNTGGKNSQGEKIVDKEDAAIHGTPPSTLNIPAEINNAEIPATAGHSDADQITKANDANKTPSTDSISSDVKKLAAPTAAMDSLAANETKQADKFKRRKNFQIGVKVSAGMTALPEKFLGGNNKSAMADNFTIGSGPGFPGLPPLNYTYDQRQSYGFEVGAWIRTAINKKASVSAGIDYTYLSTITSTGAISNTGASVYNGYQSVSLSRYYLPGELTKYRNQYHLLQIPLEYAVTWGSKSRLPFSINAGIQPGFLLSSNALLKDSSGILYSDRSNYNKFQLGMSAGFIFRLFNRTKFPLDFGPSAQYQLTNSYRKNTGYSGHLFYIGLEARMPIFNISRQQR